MKDSWRIWDGARPDVIAASFIFIYFIIGIFTLSYFPTIFNDEPWLAEASYNLIKNGIMRFTSFPNYGNENSQFGTLYMILTAISVFAFGFNVFAIRLFSFIFFIGSLVLIYLLFGRLFSKKLGLILIILIGLSPYGISASRLMRSESSVLFFFLSGVYAFYKYAVPDYKKSALAGLLFSLSSINHLTGLFAIFSGLILTIVYFPPLRSSNSIKRVLLYLCGTIPAVLVFCINLFQNWSFYLRFSEGTGLFAHGLVSKIQNFLIFIVQGFDLLLWNKIPFFFLLIVALVAFVGFFKMPKDNKKTFFGIAAASITALFFFIALAHYRHFYLYFLFVPGFLILLIPVYYFDRHKVLFYAISVFIGSFFIYQDYLWINYLKNADYQVFEKELREVIPAGVKVTGKINFRLSFPDNEYYAAEDMTVFVNRGLGSVDDYVNKYGIEYIVYDYAWFYQSRAGTAYGTPHQETVRFLNEKTELIKTFYDSYYSNKFGPDGAIHWQLPYFNLVQIAGENRLKNESYWTMIFKVKKINPENNANIRSMQ